MRHNDLFEAIFGEKYAPEAYKLVAHQWHHSKIMGKQYCKSCGLVYSNNRFTQWAVDKGCMNDVHPQYKSARKRLK